MFTLIGSFCAKYLMFDLNPEELSPEELSFQKLKSDAKFEEKLACFLENDKEFGRFSLEHLKNLKIGTLMGSFCPKQKMSEFKIYRGYMCHNNEN